MLLSKICKKINKHLIEMTFEEVRQELLELAKQENACAWGYGQAEIAKSLNELIKLIKGYISWCIKHKVATAKNLKKWFGVDFLKENNIYITGTHELQLTQQDTMIVVLGTANIKMKATHNREYSVILGENSSAVAVVEKNTGLCIQSYNSSIVSVLARRNNYVSLSKFDESKAKVQVVDEMATVTTN